MNFIYHLILGRFELCFNLVFMLYDYVCQFCSQIGLAVYMRNYCFSSVMWFSSSSLIPDFGLS